MIDTLLADARALAERLAAQAAEISLRHAGPTPFTRKSDDTPVTEVDRSIQRMIAAELAARFPGHAFLGEETVGHQSAGPATPGRADSDNTVSPKNAEYCWVVDPLDGTRNFTKGFPIVATSIALMRGDEPLVGVIREHHSGWQCSAVRGGGAVCNGRMVRVSNRTIDADTLIAVPSGRNEPTIMPILSGWLKRFVLRNVGSTALHMAYLAAGAIDAVLCHECKLWDVAAGLLMIEEAGGRCVTLQGQPMTLPTPAAYAANPRPTNFPFFAATPAVFETLFCDVRG